MRANELGCVHGVGHSGDVHGCDGCCSIIADPVRNQERERFISLIDNDFWHHRIAGNEKPTCVSDCPTCELIFLVNDVNIL